MVSQAELISKRYHSLVSGLISIFLRDGMGPFKICCSRRESFSLPDPGSSFLVFTSIFYVHLAVATFCLALETEVFSCLLIAIIHISVFLMHLMSVIAESLLGGRPTRVEVSSSDMLAGEMLAVVSEDPNDNRVAFK